MKIELPGNTFYYLMNNSVMKEWGVYIAAVLLLLVYRKLRIGRWRTILKNSVEYHKFHLASVSKDPSMDEKSRELAQALLWGATRQLSTDLKDGKGGAALWRSFIGDKTSLNTCSTVFYECARNFRYIDRIIMKLNDTLMSTFYRIYFLESYLSIAAILYMDITLLLSMITRPKSGTGRLYIEMRKNGWNL